MKLQCDFARGKKNQTATQQFLKKQFLILPVKVWILLVLPLAVVSDNSQIQVQQWALITAYYGTTSQARINFH